MKYDVVFVGGGPAGLATAIRLKQLATEKGSEINVCVLEKGSEPCAHILSGAVIDPKAITELFPNWKEIGAPLNQLATGDDLLVLSETGATRTPDWLMPRNFDNLGHAWLGGRPGGVRPQWWVGYQYSGVASWEP